MLLQDRVNKHPLNDWENPQIVGINKRPGHAHTVPYPTAEHALSGRYAESPYYQLLNGTWQFSYLPSPAAVPDAFYAGELDALAWDPIVVPGKAVSLM